MVRCMMEDELLLDYLQNSAKLPSKSLLLIASEASVDTFPRLCESYVCIHKDMIWSPENSSIKHSDTVLVKAYLDYLLAGNAQTFYGNRFSSFSAEMVAQFRHKGKRATFYNTILGPAL